jgi:hypothetical protein
MNPVYLTSYKIYATLGGVDTDITADVVTDPINANWGMYGNGVLDRIASTGTLTFTLKNPTGVYTPGSAAASTSWHKGALVKLVLTYDSKTYTRFRGTISGIKIDTAIVAAASRVYVTVADWMDTAARLPIEDPLIRANIRSDTAVGYAIAGMGSPVAASSLDVGVQTFPQIQDNLTRTTKVYSELNKIALSELGYVYLQKDSTGGETLKFESAHSRHGLRAVNTVAKSSLLAGKLLKEDGGVLLKEDGGKLLLDEQVEALFDNSMQSAEILYGGNVVNAVSITAHPKFYDTVERVLFKLDSPIVVPGNGSYTFRAYYSDPSSGERINTSSVTPMAFTDIEMWTNDDPPINITAFAGMSSADYSNSAYGVFTIANSSPYAGYITFFQVRGYGIFSRNQLTHTAESTLAATQGKQEVSVDQAYKTSLNDAPMIARSILAQHKNPGTTLNGISMIANSSDLHMEAFLKLDVGDLIRVKLTQTGTDSYYYVQNVDFSIQLGGVIKFSWRLKPALSLSLGLSLIGAEFAAASASIIDYGVMPHLNNLAAVTYAVWIKPLDITGIRSLMARWLNSYHTGFFLSTDDTIRFDKSYLSTTGIWYAPCALTVGQWAHLAVTYDASSGVTADPIFYLNGSPIGGIVELSTPVGDAANEIDLPFYLGNDREDAVTANTPAKGQLKDARVYNRILSAAEVLALYNGGMINPNIVTDGLIFQGPCVRTSELASYAGKTLTAEDDMIDNLHFYSGTPEGSPISRTS